MRIGVTGCTGFIGKYLLRDYNGKYKFIVPVRKKIQSIFDNVQYIFSDYTVSSLSEVFKDGCDAVIHLASKGMPKDNSRLIMEEYIDNTVVTAHVFETCYNLGIKRIIQMSSKAVCGATGTVINEGIKPCPVDEYGLSKLLNEKLAEFYNKERGMNIISLRMAEVCGFDLERGMLNPFWRILLDSSLHRKPIPLFGKGTAMRDLVYVKDVTRAIDVALSSDLSGVFNVAVGRLYTNREIAESFCKIFSNNGGIQELPERKEWGTDCVLDPQNTYECLGYRTMYDLDSMIKDIKEEYEKWKK